LITGILLAAGSASRFGGGKLLQLLPSGMPIGVAAARNLKAAVDRVVAVTRPADSAVFDLLSAEPGLDVIVCARSLEGMGASLSCGIAASLASAGWVVALADMPLIDAATIRAVASEIEQGAALAAPSYQGQRGHPVGIHARFRDELLALSGDAGARAILASHSQEVRLVQTGNAGILVDIDIAADLAHITQPPR
jgi:molybdenum cofactor cytidylyltransferase